MATEKQIAANRANAKLSTGPRTAAGKQKSSRNAYRHGLSRLDLSDPSSAAKVKSISGVLAAEQASEDRLMSAKEFACAQIALLRIQTIRAEQWTNINLTEDLEYNSQSLKRLASLDRYERYALTKRRKASKSLRLER
jgi:hypothetical protein